MKRIILTITLVVLFLNIGVVGCNDDQSPCENYTEQEKSKSYEWAVGDFEKGEECSITKQAEHFKISELDENNNYKYEPQEDFDGIDTVEITTLANKNDGINVCKATYRITFSVLGCGMKPEKRLLFRNIYDPCPDYTKQERAKKYECNIGDFEEGEKCYITTQPKHFKISELDEKGNYKYEPEADFIGSDFVTIETKTIAEHKLTVYITIYKIEFTVTQCGLKTKKMLISKKEYEKALIYDGCSNQNEYGIYLIINRKDYDWFPAKNLPKSFQKKFLKVLVNYTITEEKLQCHRDFYIPVVVINDIIKDTEQ